MESRETLVEIYNGSRGLWLAVILFFAGMIFMIITEKFCLKENEEENEEKSVYRMGVMTAIAIGIHNFPEGMAIFASVLKTPALGFSVATAIAIHNISVGIAVSAPIYYATGSRKKAFAFSLISGLVEPLGALVGYVLLKNYLNEKVFGMLLAAVARPFSFFNEIHASRPVKRNRGIPTSHRSLLFCFPQELFQISILSDLYRKTELPVPEFLRCDILRAYSMFRYLPISSDHGNQLCCISPEAYHR